MAGCSAKNYRTADRLVIGGTLEILEGAKVIGLEARAATAQADSTAADVAGLVADFNALLQKLRDAGILKTE